jgi:A/G-specific adenine glycosylase
MARHPGFLEKPSFSKKLTLSSVEYLTLAASWYSIAPMTAPHDNHAAPPAAIGQRLLAWYQRYGRDLPWRRTRDPYAIWLAETMLQQTQVGTVIPYYERFLARFPTVEALADAPLDDVLKAWEGLGYYARARNLHRAARRVVDDWDAQLPHTPELLGRLPGVGRYTAAAVASIAFGRDAAALDANVRRVMCRLYAVDDSPSRPATQRRLEELALATMPPGRAGDANQAFMDLGAAICVAANPRCLICPLADLCQAQQTGRQDVLPVRTVRPDRPHFDVTAAVIWGENGRFLIAQRPLESMLGGLWEFPGGKRLPGEELRACLRREIKEELAVEVEVGELLCVIDHTFTHFHMTLYAFECRIVRGEPRCLGCLDLRWVLPEAAGAFAFPVADQKILAFVRERQPGVAATPPSPAAGSLASGGDPRGTGGAPGGRHRGARPAALAGDR